MKIYLIILIILFNVFNQQNILSQKSISDNDSILSFTGLWINKQYVDAINETKSPISALKDINVSYIYIPKKIHQNVSMIFDFHVGGGDLTIEKKDGQYYFYTSDLKKEIERVSIKDNILTTGNESFIKVSQTDDYGILETILFKGKYRLGSKLVEFHINGKISGWDDFNEYIPVSDYSGPGLNLDQIILKTPEHKILIKGFKFIKDNLLIYDLNCEKYDSANQQCDSYSLGSLQYKLTKN